jgi:hypothetical protein
MCGWLGVTKQIRVLRFEVVGLAVTKIQDLRDTTPCCLPKTLATIQDLAVEGRGLINVKDKGITLV